MYLVLAVAIANLALGYLAAASLAEPPFWKNLSSRLRSLRLVGRRRSDSLAAPPTGAAAPPDAAPPSQDVPPLVPENTSSPKTIAGVNELPEQWLKDLAAEGIVPESFVEGAAHVLRLEVVHYREHLLALEQHCRGLAGSSEASAAALLGRELQAINRDWLDRQTAAAGMLSQRAGRLGDHEAAAAALEQVLLDQAAEIQGICTELETPCPASDVAGGIKRIAEGTSSLIDHAHTLRDRMFDLLATLLRTGNRLDSLPPTSLLDSATGLPNRTGVESIFVKWWRDDPERSRPLSVILIDLDRFSRLNQRFGSTAGDETIVALAKLFQELLRGDSGTDRLGRIGGQSFIILMGDAGPREALTAAERLRQTVEATTFDKDGAEFELTVSCGVIEVGQSDSSLDLLSRAGQALRFAKKAGRNRCSIDEGNGPATLEPPQFPVKGRVLRLGAP